MEFGLAAKVSWLCLLISGAVCFPATLGVNKPSQSSQEAPSVATAAYPAYEPSGLPAPVAYSTGAGYPRPAHTGVVSLPLAAAGSGGHSNAGPSLAAYSPTYEVLSSSYSSHPAGSSLGGHRGSFTGGLANRRIPEGVQVFPSFGGSAGAAFDPSSQSQSSGAKGVWDTAEETSLPVPPPSYIIQRWNGYNRYRDLYSHKRYSPEFPEPITVLVSKPAAAPSKTPVKARPQAPVVAQAQGKKF